MQQEQQEQRKGLQLLADMIMVAANLAAMGVLLWEMMSPLQRQQAAMVLARFRLRLVSGLAVRAGRVGMVEELAGRDPAPFYGQAARLAELKHRLAKGLES